MENYRPSSVLWSHPFLDHTNDHLEMLTGPRRMIRWMADDSSPRMSKICLDFDIYIHGLIQFVLPHTPDNLTKFCPRRYAGSFQGRPSPRSSPCPLMNQKPHTRRDSSWYCKALHQHRSLHNCNRHRWLPFCSKDIFVFVPTGQHHMILNNLTIPTIDSMTVLALHNLDTVSHIHWSH